MASWVPKKKEKKQKIRFQDEADTAGGRHQSEAGFDPWEARPTENAQWGRIDESGWEEDPEDGMWDNVANGGMAAEGGQRSGGWSSWGQHPEPTWSDQNTPRMDSSKAKTLLKSGAPGIGEAKTSISMQDQTAILNSLLSHPGAQRASLVPQHHIQQALPTAKYQQPSHYQPMHRHQQYGPTWDDIPEEDEDELEYADDDEEEEEWDYANDQPQKQHRYIPQHSPYQPSPSKTLANAMGSPEFGRSFGSPPTGPDSRSHRFIESQGAALSRAHNALFAQDRMAKQRFHWSFSPDKDERVRSLLQWIERMSEGVGVFGLHKFLQTRERGAFFVNADYRHYQSPDEPAFDWLSIDQLKDTMDKILQESVALYNPATQAIVFVFLLSKTGNSMAIWRRKIPVAEQFQKTYQKVIDETMSNLKADYPVYVDELPAKTKQKKQLRVLTKLKWWKR